MDETQTLDIINVLKKLQDARFELELMSIKYGDPQNTLKACSEDITQLMHGIGCEFLYQQKAE